MPAVETFISMAIHTTVNSTMAAKVRARWRFSGSTRVMRSTVPQRVQLLRSPGAIAGTIWKQAAARALPELRLGHPAQAASLAS